MVLRLPSSRCPTGLVIETEFQFAEATAPYSLLKLSCPVLCCLASFICVATCGLVYWMIEDKKRLILISSKMITRIYLLSTNTRIMIIANVITVTNSHTFSPNLWCRRTSSLYFHCNWWFHTSKIHPSEMLLQAIEDRNSFSQKHFFLVFC